MRCNRIFFFSLWWRSTLLEWILLRCRQRRICICWTIPPHVHVRLSDAVLEGRHDHWVPFNCRCGGCCHLPDCSLKGQEMYWHKVLLSAERNHPSRTLYISSHYLPPRYRYLRLGVASQFTTRLTLVLFIWTICHSCRVCKGRRSLSQSAVGSFLGMKWN